MSRAKPKTKRRKRHNQHSGPASLQAIPTETDEGHIKSHADQEQETHQNMTRKVYEWMFAGKSAAWTAIFTCALVVFSGLLWQVSKDANDSSMASQRAFLSIAFSPRLDVVAANGRITGYNVHMGWVNNGTTPTETATAQFNVAANWPDRPQRGFDFARLPQAERQEYVLGPKATWEVRTVPLSFGDVDAALGGRHIFAWGWIVYRDVFKGTPPRLSEFCFELTNPRWSGLDHTDPSVAFVVDSPPCQVHNCYDERCEDYTQRSREIR